MEEGEKKSMLGEKGPEHTTKDILRGARKLSSG